MKSLFSALKDNARRNPDRLAVVGPNLSLTNKDAFESAYSAVIWLESQGVKPKDRVALRLTPETECVFLAALDGLGATAAIVRSNEQIAKLGLWGFSHLVVNTEVTPQVGINTMLLEPSGIKEAVPEPDFEGFVWQEDADYRILFTSGTTGTPKAIALSKKKFDLRVHRARESWLKVEPFMIMFGLDVSTTQLALSHSIESDNPFLIPRGAKHTSDLLESWQIASINGSEAQYRGLVSEGLEATLGIEQLAIAGSFPTAAITSDLRDLFPNATQHIHFGSTEAGLVFFSELIPGQRNLGTPASGVTVSLLGSSGNQVSEGLLAITSDSLAVGYLGEQETTQQSFQKAGFIPGDVLRRNPDGSFEYLGREDSLINLGGVKLNPEVIEEFVEAWHPGTEALLRINDHQLELQYAAKTEIDENQLAKELVLKFGTKAPKSVRRVLEIPRNAAGKKVRRDY